MVSVIFTKAALVVLIGSCCLLRFCSLSFCPSLPFLSILFVLILFFYVIFSCPSPLVPILYTLRLFTFHCPHFQIFSVPMFFPFSICLTILLSLFSIPFLFPLLQYPFLMLLFSLTLSPFPYSCPLFPSYSALFFPVSSPIDTWGP